MNEAIPAGQVFEDYLVFHARNETDRVLALFAPDAVVEDPVGADAIEGLAEIGTFYRGLHATNGLLQIEPVAPPLVAGRELAAHVRAGLTKPGSPPAMDVIYFLELTTEGKISRLRAFY